MTWIGVTQRSRYSKLGAHGNAIVDPQEVEPDRRFFTNWGHSSEEEFGSAAISLSPYALANEMSGFALFLRGTMTHCFTTGPKMEGPPSQ